MTRALLVFGALVLLTACQSWDERQGHVCGDSLDATCDGDGDATPAEEVADEEFATECPQAPDAEFPDVVAATLEPRSDGRFTLAATVCSTYDTPERYADAFRVRTPDGEVLAVRELLHDHAGEQPFTRSVNEPFAVPDGVTMLVIEGRDLVNGWGGATDTVSVPPSDG